MLERFGDTRAEGRLQSRLDGAAGSDFPVAVSWSFPSVSWFP